MPNLVCFSSAAYLTESGGAIAGKTLTSPRWDCGSAESGSGHATGEAGTSVWPGT